MNDRVVVFEDPRITVWCSPKQRVIHHQMHEPVLGTVFQKALLAGAEAMEKYGARKWLSDDRKNGALFPEDLQWVETVWIPRVLKAGWRYWALLPPASVVGKMNIRQHIELHKERGVLVEIFTDLEQAHRWLANQL